MEILSVLTADAKAGGTAPNLAKVTKHKMQCDEALKILHIEGRKSLNEETLLQVRVYSASRILLLFEDW